MEGGRNENEKIGVFKMYSLMYLKVKKTQRHTNQA